MKKLLLVMITIFCMAMGGGVLAACTYLMPCEHKNATVTVTATCTQPGIIRTECPDCGNVTEEAIGALGHDFIVQLVNPTCTAAGSRKSACSRCEESVTDILPATGHSYQTQSETPATCTVDGIKVSVCEACGDRKEETLPAPGHGYQEQSVAATCMAGGYTVSTCSVCGDIVREETDPALGHQFERGETVLPTCTERGFTWYECARCPEKEQRESQAALGHGTPVAAERIEPTCTEEGGEDGMECPRCHELLVPYTPVPALGHNFGEGGDELKCTREDCGILIGDEAALEQRFKNATVYTPKRVSDVPTAVTDEAVVIDLAEYQDSLLVRITVRSKNVRVIEKENAHHGRICLSLDPSLTFCFIDIQNVNNIIDKDYEYPFIESEMTGTVFLCASKGENRIAAAYNRLIRLPNATLKVVGRGNLQMFAQFRTIWEARVVEANEVVFYPYAGATFTFEGAGTLRGKDGASYDRSAASTDPHNGEDGGNGSSGGDAIRAQKVTFYMAGNLVIKGGNGGSGGNGGDGEGSDESGNGHAGKGGAGGHGSMGGSAIVCHELEAISLGGKAELYAGDGGNGGNGGNGGHAFDAHVRDDAGDGGTGGGGGQAGFCILFLEQAYPSLNADITLHGGKGGNGGNGGSGGNGVTKSSLFEKSLNGRGGDGGSGGETILTKMCNSYNDVVYVLGKGGTGGKGGAKGTGGYDQKDNIQKITAGGDGTNGKSEMNYADPW